MPKSTFFTGQPIFTQLLSLIPKSIIHSLSRTFDSDRYFKKFKTYDHVVSMLFSTFQLCKTLKNKQQLNVSMGVAEDVEIKRTAGLSLVSQHRKFCISILSCDWNPWSEE